MTEQEALAAIAAVDQFRQAAVRVLPSLEALEAALLDCGHDSRAMLKAIGIEPAVRRWVARQRLILANGDADQQAILSMLLAPDDDDQRSHDDRPTASELEALILRWCAS
jgi:hypothetical protein